MVKEPNILFIVIDALRSKNLGCYGYRRPTSPHIDKLAQEGILFENAFCCANTTDPSLTSIFSGKYPLSHGITQHAERVRIEHIRRFNESGTYLLPEILKTIGFHTLAVDWLGRWHRRGYDYYSGILELHRFKPHTLLLNVLLGRLPTIPQTTLHRIARPLFSLSERKDIDNAKIMTDKAISLIKQYHREKFFIFIHYWDVHAPYGTPEPYIDEFAKQDYENEQSVEEVLKKFDREHRAYARRRIPKGVQSIEEVLARYDASIAFVDNEVGRLLTVLEELGILDQTLIILTADHGESLLEHGIYFEHHGLYDVTIKVPLIFRYPPSAKNSRVQGMVQHVDLIPTILDILGLDVGAFDFDGKSLVPLLDDGEQIRSAVYVEEFRDEKKRTIRTPNYKFISALSERDASCKLCGYVHGGTKELYDVNKDGEEIHNIFQENRNLAMDLKDKLSKWVRFIEFKRGKRLIGQPFPDEFLEDEEVVKERLKALGYF